MNKMKDILIAYHADCIDGFTSAWVTHNAIKDSYEGIEINLFPMYYSEESNVELLRLLHNRSNCGRLYVVDFSLSTNVLAVISADFNVNVHIIDHHKTAYEKYGLKDYYELGKAVRDCKPYMFLDLDTNECGASLCWKTFYPAIPAPKLISYVKDYDLWKFEHGDLTRHINKFLNSEEKTIENWDRIAAMLETSDGHKEAIMTGKVLQDEHDRMVGTVVKGATPFVISGEKGLAVQCLRKYASDVGNQLAEQSGTFGATFVLDIEANKIQWSLRSIGDYDVSAIAKKYGGGGHKNAAGFETELLSISPHDLAKIEAL